MRRRAVLLLLCVLVAACGIGPAPATILGGAPDTSASALAARRAALSEDEVGTSVPATGDDVPGAAPPLDAVGDADDGVTALVLLLRQGEPVWVRRLSQDVAPDPVLRALATLAEPLRPEEIELGLTTAVPLGTRVRAWERRGDRLELGVAGAGLSGGTTTALRLRAWQLACTARAALDPLPVGVDVVTGVSTESVEAGDCPPLPGG